MIVQRGQSWFDVSVQLTGSIEAAVIIATAFNVSVNDVPKAGLDLSSLDLEVINKRVKDYYNKKGVVPATMAN